jgi:signal transduction histidine kinase
MRLTLPADRGWRAAVLPARRPVLGPLAAGIVALALSLGVLTIALLAAPGLSPVVRDPSLELVINTAATIIAGGVAGLGWVRYQETGRVATLLQASAFLVLAVTNAVFVALALAGLDGAYGSSLASVGQAPIYAWSFARLVVAVLLLASVVIDPAMPSIDRRKDWLLFLAPAGLALLALATFGMVADQLHPLMLPVPGAALPVARPAAQAVALLTGLVFLAATVGAYRHATTGARAEGYLAIGLLIATAAQIHFAIYPAVFTDLVTSEDILRTLFGIALLVGIAAQQRGDLHDLRSAHADLARFRDAEVERAAIEERARLAREFHDGLAQELWTARLQHARLGEAERLSPAARRLWQETSSALERALRSARDALQAMRSLEDDAPFNEALTRELEGFEDRSGVRVVLRRDPSPLAVPLGRRREILRIIGEALSNIERHADATVVRVHVRQQGPSLVVELADNGRGFEPRRRPSGRFGLLGMRERAHVLGGVLAIDAQPLAGTRIRLTVPVTGEAA